mmetsp:Transcript_12121/g.29592  ORF Transcript_12121/g.29592 Transcript_12121/m.29592 type:complete len:386 (-) Transcript_12121:162-1319(-)
MPAMGTFFLLPLLASSAVCAFKPLHPAAGQKSNVAASAHRHQSELPLPSPSALPTTSPRRPPFQLKHIDHVVIRCKRFPPMFDFYHRILGCAIDEPRDDHVNRFGGALTHLRAGSCYIDLLAYDADHLTEEGRDAASRMHGGGAGLAGDCVSLADANRRMSSETSTLDHLCLRIDDYDEEHMMNYLEEEHVDIVQRETAGDKRLGADGVGPSVYVRDPEGNVIELKGNPDQESNDRGSIDNASEKNHVDRASHAIGDTMYRMDRRDVDNDESPSNNATQTSTEQSSDSPNPIPSQTPCTRICRYNSSFYDGQVCIGCFREAYEIKMWQSSTPAQKAMTLLDAIDRLSNNDCPSGDGAMVQNFDGAITREELTRQYVYWSDLANTR